MSELYEPIGHCDLWIAQVQPNQNAPDFPEKLGDSTDRLANAQTLVDTLARSGVTTIGHLGAAADDPFTLMRWPETRKEYEQPASLEVYNDPGPMFFWFGVEIYPFTPPEDKMLTVIGRRMHGFGDNKELADPSELDRTSWDATGGHQVEARIKNDGTVEKPDWTPEPTALVETDRTERNLDALLAIAGEWNQEFVVVVNSVVHEPGQTAIFKNQQL